MESMGFALWMNDEVAVAQGTHEYRPMGIAVISSTDIFTPRDFRRLDRAKKRTGESFVGLFASLNHVNRFLRHRRSQANKNKLKTASRRLLAII